MIKRTITSQTSQAEKWNLFIDLVVMEIPDDLSEIQKAAQLCFLYDGEVQNGGHMQYFLNQGISRLDDCIHALAVIGANKQADILTEAKKVLDQKGIADINTVEDYVAEALEDKFGDMDEAYYECQPDVASLLEAFISKHEDEFYEVMK